MSSGALVTHLEDEWEGAAEGWRTWAPIFESAVEPVTSVLVHLADLQPGQRVLDVATGFGEPALTASRWVEPKGTVVMADAEDHDLLCASFDAALCRFGLSFAPNLAGTLKRLVALLVPGGRLAVAVWGPPGRCPALSVPLAIMREFMDHPSVAPGAAGMFGLGGEGVIEDELHFAGCTDVRSRCLTVLFNWASPEQFASFHQGVAVPIHGALSTVPVENRHELREALLSAARTRAERDGGLRLPAEVVVVVGRRPTTRDGVIERRAE